jgi:hypothetical protein
MLALRAVALYCRTIPRVVEYTMTLLIFVPSATRLVHVPPPICVTVGELVGPGPAEAGNETMPAQLDDVNVNDPP